MPGWHPIKRREFIRKLKALGFSGPFRGTRHEFLAFDQQRQTIPSNSDYSLPQLKMLLRQVKGILGHRISPDQTYRNQPHPLRRRLAYFRLGAMSYMRGKYYLWTGSDGVHLWAFDGENAEAIEKACS